MPTVHHENRPDLENISRSLEFQEKPKILGISDFSRHLAFLQGKDILFQSIVKDTVELLQVDFGKLFSLERNGRLVCRAEYCHPPHGIDFYQNPWEPILAGPVYDRAMYQESPWTLQADREASSSERQVLRILKSKSLIFIPLRITSTLTGLLVLGNQQEKFDEIKRSEFKYLAALIGVQIAYELTQADPQALSKLDPYDIVLAFNRVLEMHSPVTGTHTRRLVWLANSLASEAGFSPEESLALRWAALLHDIGKIAIPDQILLKPARLNDAEWDVMKKHPLIGADIVSMMHELSGVEAFIQSHHENFDGSGYPYHLRGEEIPFGGRMIAVIDSYCAMTEGRVYQAARTHNEAIEEIKYWAGIHYDPQVVTPFLHMMEREKHLVLAYWKYIAP
jgi:putative nucleotidyltransferase with HDIG domain